VVSGGCHGPAGAREATSGQLLDAEQEGEPEQREPGQLLGALAQRLVQTCAQRAKADVELLVALGVSVEV
jgi:hypothetical protein